MRTRLAVTFCMLAFFTATASGADLLIGTWKQNSAKTKYNPGPGFQHNTVKFETLEGGIRLTADGSSTPAATSASTNLACRARTRTA